MIDIAFTTRRIAVFVDGCFWHGCPEHGVKPKHNARWWQEKIRRNRERDADTTRRLEAEGWRVIRVWEHEGAERAAERVAAALAQTSKESTKAPRSTSGMRSNISTPE